MGKSSKRKGEMPTKEELLKKLQKLERKILRVSENEAPAPGHAPVAQLPTSPEAILKERDLTVGLPEHTDASENLVSLDTLGTDKPAQESQEVNAQVPDDVPSVDEELLVAMGIDASSPLCKEMQITSQLAAQWTSWIRCGIKKEMKAELLVKYPRTGNCPLEAPKLNPEIAASLFETSIKRDKHFAYSQNLLGSALSALGAGITLLVAENGEGVDKRQLLQHLGDAGKLLACAHNQELVARKHCIYPSFDKKVKSILESLNSDEFLFGQDLAEKIKSAKTIEKVGLELKPPASAKPAPPRQSTANAGNWKGPSVRFHNNYKMGNNQNFQKNSKSQQYQQQQKSNSPHNATQPRAAQQQKK